MASESNSCLPTLESIDSDFSESESIKSPKEFEIPDICPEIFQELGEETELQYYELHEKLITIYDVLCSEIETVNIRDFSTYSPPTIELKNPVLSRLSQRRSVLNTINVL